MVKTGEETDRTPVVGHCKERGSSYHHTGHTYNALVLEPAVDLVLLGDHPVQFQALVGVIRDDSGHIYESVCVAGGGGCAPR